MHSVNFIYQISIFLGAFSGGLEASKHHYRLPQICSLLFLSNIPQHSSSVWRILSIDHGQQYNNLKRKLPTNLLFTVFLRQLTMVRLRPLWRSIQVMALLQRFWIKVFKKCSHDTFSLAGFCSTSQSQQLGRLMWWEQRRKGSQDRGLLARTTVWLCQVEFQITFYLFTRL